MLLASQRSCRDIDNREGGGGWEIVVGYMLGCVIFVPLPILPLPWFRLHDLEMVNKRNAISCPDAEELTDLSLQADSAD